MSCWRKSGATVNSLLGVTEMVALLEKLRNAIADFAAREEKLNQGFQLKIAAETRAFEAAQREQTSQQAGRLAEAESSFQTQKENAQARFERRKTKINEAHKRLRRTAMEDITTREGRRKHKLQ